MSIGVMKERIGLKQDVLDYIRHSIFQVAEDKYEVSWEYIRIDLLMMFAKMLRELECNVEMKRQYKQVICDILESQYMDS